MKKVYFYSFLIGYILIILLFIGQLGGVYYTLRDSCRRKIFYGISLISINYIGLIFSFIFGGLCMIAPMFSYWLSIVLCSIVFIFNIVAVLKISVADELANEINLKIKKNTFFIKSLIIESQKQSQMLEAKQQKKETKSLSN